VRAAGCAILLATAAACSSLRMTTPETGAGGAAGNTAGAAGSGGDAGSGGSGGTGAAGAAGTIATGRGGTSGGAGGAAGGGEPAGLIAHWLFDEGAGTSVADSSGNGQLMTLSATGATWLGQGHQGKAITFDGSNGYAEMTPTPSQVLSSYPVVKLTFSAWVKPDATAAARPFATAVARAHEDYAFQDFWIGLVAGKPGCIIHDGNWEGAIGGGVAPAGVWMHIACTYALDGTVTLYVNGGYGASASSGQTIGPIPPRILVGAAETDPGNGRVLQSFFPGAIDDVRIYNETLSPAQITFIAR
jgi:hypothetical protein